MHTCNMIKTEWGWGCGLPWFKGAQQNVQPFPGPPSLPTAANGHPLCTSSFASAFFLGCLQSTRDLVQALFILVSLGFCLCILSSFQSAERYIGFFFLPSMSILERHIDFEVNLSARYSEIIKLVFFLSQPDVSF